jgi:hypothetical protein
MENRKAFDQINKLLDELITDTDELNSKAIKFRDDLREINKSFLTPEFEPLPEGIEFNHYKDSDYLWFKFGNGQMITYRDDVDYIVRERFPSLFEPNATSKCHLEPCKIEDLKAGDWYIYQAKLKLFVSERKCFTAYNDGEIRAVNPYGGSLDKIKKIVYQP